MTLAWWLTIEGRNKHVDGVETKQNTRHQAKAIDDLNNVKKTDIEYSWQWKIIHSHNN